MTLALQEGMENTMNKNRRFLTPQVCRGLGALAHRNQLRAKEMGERRELNKWDAYCVDREHFHAAGGWDMDAWVEGWDSEANDA